MTEKPARTMTLQPYEWRSLVATGANNVYSFIGAIQPENPPDAMQMAWLHDTLDRLKMQVSAWAASGQPQLTTSSTVTKTAEEMQHDIVSNGFGPVASAAASGPKKKRGWQKGRKRGPRKPKGSEAVQ